METGEKVSRRKRKLLSARSKQVIIKCLLLIATSFFLVWLLEYRYFLNDPAKAWSFVFSRPLVFIYSTLIMLFILLFIYGIFRKPFLTIGITTGLVLIFGYIHIAKFNFRGAPLFPDDFTLGSQAGTLTKFVDVGGIVRLVIATILCVVLGVLLDRITEKWLKNTKVKSNVWWYRYRIISRVAIITVAIAGFLITTDFARNHSGERTIKLSFLDSKFIDWDQTQNYNDNGFLIGFLYNLSKLQITAPDGYNEQKMAEIRSKLETKKTESDAEKKPISDVSTNIIFILNESFYDPTLLAGDIYRIDGDDVTPNLHRIQDSTLSGHMYSVDYGGGTANIEYEALTGFTNYWLKTMPYPNLMPKQKKTMPSMATFAKENGFKTTTIHPFNGGIYKRETVLPKIGFDELIFENEFSHRETYGNSEYINDGETYSELFDLLKNSDEKQFVSVITMQNHAPYSAGLYGETKFKVSAGENGTPLTENEKNSAETYLMTLHKSDEYLGKLIDSLNNFDEKTIVLFYGDHSAGVFPQVIENEDKNISDSARQTPYFIYANFDLGENNYNLKTTTPNCMANTLLNILEVEKPLHFYLLDDVCSTDPILTDAYFGAEAPFMTTELSEYNLLTYDQIAGKQYY